MKVFIYTLSDPRTPENTRYVGVSVNPPGRLSSHLWQCEHRRTRKDCWIKGIKRLGLRPVMTVIEETDELIWEQREVFWIARYRVLGFDLVNSCDGGRANLSPSPETRMRMSVAMKEIHASRTPEHRKAIGVRLHLAKQGMSDEHKKELAKRKSIWTRKNMLRLHSSMTHEDRSAIAKAGHKTRALNGTIAKPRNFCRNGHQMSGENVRYESGGKVRRCGACANARKKAWRKNRHQTGGLGIEPIGFPPTR